MGKPSIKRDGIKHANRLSKMLKHGRIPVVSVALDIKTREILVIGIDHSSVAAKLTGIPEGSWEITEYPVCQ